MNDVVLIPLGKLFRDGDSPDIIAIWKWRKGLRDRPLWPLEVQDMGDGRYEILDGIHRYEAMLQDNREMPGHWTEYPCIIVDSLERLQS